MSRYFLANGYGYYTIVFMGGLIIFRRIYVRKSADFLSISGILVLLMPALINWPIRALLEAEKLTRGLNVISPLLYNATIPKESNSYTYVQEAFYVFIFLYLLILLIADGIESKDYFWFINPLIYLAGLASGAIIGFSPTAYASGERTQFFTTILFLIICYREMQMIQNKRDNT